MSNPAIFEEYKIRRVYDEKTEMWFFSVVDVVQALTQQLDNQKARKYWNKLKERLKNEGSETVTNCHQLKMTAEDCKQRLPNFLRDKLQRQLRLKVWLKTSSLVSRAVGLQRKRVLNLKRKQVKK